MSPRDGNTTALALRRFQCIPICTRQSSDPNECPICERSFRCFLPPEGVIAENDRKTAQKWNERKENVISASEGKETLDEL